MSASVLTEFHTAGTSIGRMFFCCFASGTTHLIRDYDGALGTIGRHVTSIDVCQVAGTGVIELNVATTATGASTSSKTLYFYVTPRPEA